MCMCASLQVPRVSVGVVNLGYDTDIVPPQYRGFGYLIPSNEVRVAKLHPYSSACSPEAACLQPSSPTAARCARGCVGQLHVSDTRQPPRRTRHGHVWYDQERVGACLWTFFSLCVYGPSVG